MNNKIKVAAYCRVSTDNEDQLNSLSTQMDYFKKYISNNPEWELVEVYFDEGITGTSVKKQTAYYDSEIVRLTEEIAQKQNITAQQDAQLDEIKKTIEQIRSFPEYKT